jgi:D-sedoheptulose 7-phosphate isomerase
MLIKKKFETDLNENISTHFSLLQSINEIEKIINKLKICISQGGKILFCGNGGSAADAQHLAAEFLVRLKPGVNRKPIAALSLVQDVSTITACGNDYNFDELFQRNLQALGSKKDVLVCISTSGNSKNILKVLKEANKRKIYSVGFLGNKGGKAKKYCDSKLVVNSNNTARIQECHIFLGHFILEAVEKKLLNNNKFKK